MNVVDDEEDCGENKWRSGLIQLDPDVWGLLDINTPCLTLTSGTVSLHLEDCLLK